MTNSFPVPDVGFKHNIHVSPVVFPFINFECIVSEETACLYCCVVKVMYTKLIIVICSVMANLIVTLVGVISLVKYRIISVLFSSAQFPITNYRKRYVTNLILYFCCDLKACRKGNIFFTNYIKFHNYIISMYRLLVATVMYVIYFVIL